MAAKVSKTSTSKNYWNTKKQPSHYKKYLLLRISKHYMDNKIAWFLRCRQPHVFNNWLNNIWRSEDDVKTIRLTSCLGRGRRLRLNRKCNFAGPRHFHVLLTSASCFLKPSNSQSMARKSRPVRQSGLAWLIWTAPNQERWNFTSEKSSFTAFDWTNNVFSLVKIYRSAFWLADPNVQHLLAG